MTRNLIFSFIKIAENIREMKRYLILKMANIYLEKWQELSRKWRELSRKRAGNIHKNGGKYFKMAGNSTRAQNLLYYQKSFHYERTHYID
jgi:hypothetical protein